MLFSLSLAHVLVLVITKSNISLSYVQSDVIHRSWYDCVISMNYIVAGIADASLTGCYYRSQTSLDKHFFWLASGTVVLVCGSKILVT